jgi:hypothetical protein
VKLVQKTQDNFVFELAKWERRLLFSVLKLYPRIPPAHHTLSKAESIPDRQINQRLLDEALAEQRAENQKQLRLLLTDPGRLSENDSCCQLRLSPPDIEWLLQVLNDVRVGSWILLGSPEHRLEVTALSEKTSPHIWALEMADHFQWHLLEALQEGAGS